MGGRGGAGDDAHPDPDPQANPTILSGAIGVPGDVTDNSYHVVIGADDARLSGFTVSDGNADGVGSDGCGGGMYNRKVSPTVDRVVFRDNSATYGGGMFNRYSSPKLERVVFRGNSATKSGGAVQNELSEPEFFHVEFTENSATEAGGGMYNGGVADVSNPFSWYYDGWGQASVHRRGVRTDPEWSP